MCILEAGYDQHMILKMETEFQVHFTKNRLIKVTVTILMQPLR